MHNAIRKTIGMDHGPDDPSHRLSYLNAISALIEQAGPVRINFGSLLLEKSTAKRTFMIIAQLLKYVDATQPIRFLIAECETGFTLLTALYFAKLFGVEDKVEISPLFETQTALEQGGRAIAEAWACELSRLCPKPRPALRADRLLRCRPLARPDRRRLRDRAPAPCDRPRAGAPGPGRRRAGDLRHPWRIDRSRLPSRELRRPPGLRRHAGGARRSSPASASPASRR